MKSKKPNPENPTDFRSIQLEDQAVSAAGMPAVSSAIAHVLKEMDPLRGFKALAKLNQKGGFDCPGCAWPDPDDERSPMAEYCENGAKAIAEEATSKRLDAAFFQQNSIESLALLDDYDIGKKGRIAQPMYLAKGASHYAPIAWKDAFSKIAAQLKNCHANEAVFYTSGRTSNEAAFLYQLFVRAYGTNNLPDCSNMCHESSGVALGESLGLGKGSVTLDDFNHADVILILGQNPGTNHPRMLSALEKAKEKGCTIISINPLKEAGLMAFKNPQRIKGILGKATTLTDIYLQVKINGDMALLKAIAKRLLEEDARQGNILDHAFIQAQTIGFDAWKSQLEEIELAPLLAQSGITKNELEQVVDVLCKKQRIIACWAMGLTQHPNSVAMIQEIVNVLLMKGSIGKQGAGTCPVRGHSNVQGDRTMGIYEKPAAAFLDNIERSFGFKPPRQHGYDVVEAIEAMHEGKVKVFFAMGGNFLSATPDTLYTAEALNKCALTVQVSTKLNRSHLITGEEAIILPTLGRSDIDMTGGEQQFISCENSMGVVQASKGHLKPVSQHLLSEPEIVVRLAEAVLGDSFGIDWSRFIKHYDHIRDAIERSIPGFNDYNKRIREKAGFYLPNGPRVGRFTTQSGKAHFTLSPLPEHTLGNDELVMMTIRSHDQFNTTIYGLDDRYRGIYNERRVILMNKSDITRLGFKTGDHVDIFNHHGNKERVARRFIIIAYSIPEGCCATYFPETNVLVPINSTAAKSNTPTSKWVVVTLQKHRLQ